MDTVDNVKLAAESQRRREDAEALKEFKASQDKFLEEEEKRRKAEALGSVGGASRFIHLLILSTFVNNPSRKISFTNMKFFGVQLANFWHAWSG